MEFLPDRIVKFQKFNILNLIFQIALFILFNMLLEMQKSFSNVFIDLIWPIKDLLQDMVKWRNQMFTKLQPSCQIKI